MVLEAQKPVLRSDVGVDLRRHTLRVYDFDFNATKTLTRFVEFDTIARHILESDDASLPSTSISRSVRLLYHALLQHLQPFTPILIQAALGSNLAWLASDTSLTPTTEARCVCRLAPTSGTARPGRRPERLRTRQPRCERGLANAERGQRTFASPSRGTVLTLRLLWSLCRLD